MKSIRAAPEADFFDVFAASLAVWSAMVAAALANSMTSTPAWIAII